MKKNYFLLLSAAIFNTAVAQVDAGDMARMFADGYTIRELEDIYHSVSVSNHRKLLTRKRFKYIGTEGQEIYYEKNEVVDLGIKYSGNEITRTWFHSSPQKYYQALRLLEEDGQFRKIYESKQVRDEGTQYTFRKWLKGDLIFFAEDLNYNIGIYKYYRDEKQNAADWKSPEVHASVRIGTQVWSSMNLNADRFRNGDLIAEAKSATAWKKAGEEGIPAWCYMKNESALGGTYGRLYNWHAIRDERGLAPAGWHVPAKAEVDEMIQYLGGPEAAAGKLKTSQSWKENGGGNNSSRFSALPGGMRYKDGSFGDFEYGAYFWTISPADSKAAALQNTAHYFILQSRARSVMNDHTAAFGYGCAVRFVKDK